MNVFQFAPKGATQFDPADLSGLVYRADPVYSYSDMGGTSTPATDGGAVGTVNPLVGGAYLQVDLIGQRPTFAASGLNGRPTLAFNGSHKLRASFTLAQPYTRIVVWRHRDGEDNNHVMMDGYTNDTAYLNFVSAGTLRMYAGAAGPNRTATSNVWYTSVEGYDAASSFLRLNGGTAGTGNPGTASPNGVNFGSQGDSGTSYGTQSDLAYLLVYSRLLNTGEQDSVFAWLRTRFAHY